MPPKPLRRSAKSAPKPSLPCRTRRPSTGTDISSRECLWKGPLEDGITFSLLTRFLECRERFRLKVVEGLEEGGEFNHKIEYGSLWHEAEEAHGGGHDWLPAMRAYRDKLLAAYPGSEATINKWFQIARHTFPVYLDHWAKEDRDEKARKPALEEYAFKVPYLLPSGRSVTLRGKFDRVFTLKKGKKTEVWLQENKTKGDIDEEGIQATLPLELQTGLYQVALRTLQDQGLYPFADADKIGTIKGVLYNVIRRPLSDRFAIRQKKSESEAEFFIRMAEGVKADPSHYFKRWNVTLLPSDIETLKDRVLNPILEQLCDWWDWIQVDPHNPWRLPKPGGGVFGTPGGPGEFENWSALNIPGGGIHYQSPWGCYNSLASGWRGSYFKLLTGGSRVGLRRIDTLFPELS